MTYKLFCCAIIFLPAQVGLSQVGSAANESSASKTDKDDLAIRAQFKSHADAFNKHDALAVGSHWTGDAVSVAEETGERTEGRDALVRDFATFFTDHPDARLSGVIERIHLVAPNVASIEGRTTLFLTDEPPADSVFTAIVVKSDGKWLIASSRERDVPSPPTPYDALKELEWLVGSWRDETGADVKVSTTIRWSANQAFLIRSYIVEDASADTLEGTEVIGWDPISKQIRTWTFNSDGSFGQGTATKHDDEVMLKMWQIVNGGELAAATRIITRIDDRTMTVRSIGETLNGEPVPSSDPVTVIRVDEPASTTSVGVVR